MQSGDILIEIRVREALLTLSRAIEEQQRHIT
jgi:hypothetical protein